MSTKPHWSSWFASERESDENDTEPFHAPRPAAGSSSASWVEGSSLDHRFSVPDRAPRGGSHLAQASPSIKMATEWSSSLHSRAPAPAACKFTPKIKYGSSRRTLDDSSAGIASGFHTSSLDAAKRKSWRATSDSEVENITGGDGEGGNLWRRHSRSELEQPRHAVDDASSSTAAQQRTATFLSSSPSFVKSMVEQQRRHPHPPPPHQDTSSHHNSNSDVRGNGLRLTGDDAGRFFSSHSLPSMNHHHDTNSTMATDDFPVGHSGARNHNDHNGRDGEGRSRQHAAESYMDGDVDQDDVEEFHGVRSSNAAAERRSTFIGKKRPSSARPNWKRELAEEMQNGEADEDEEGGNSSSRTRWMGLQRHLRRHTHATSISVLDLTACTLGNEEWVWLCRSILPQLSSLTSLTLAFMDLTDVHAGELLRGLTRSCDGSSITDAGSAARGQSAATHAFSVTEEESLPSSLHRHAQSSSSAWGKRPHLASPVVLPRRPHTPMATSHSINLHSRALPFLRLLDLTGNQLTYRGATHLGKLILWAADSLDAVCLASNPLKDHGMQVLGIYLAKLTVRSLRDDPHLLPGSLVRQHARILRGTNTSRDIQEALSAMHLGPQLLDVRDCRASARGVSDLLAGASHVSRLTTVTLAHNVAGSGSGSESTGHVVLRSSRQETAVLGAVAATSAHLSSGSVSDGRFAADTLLDFTASALSASGVLLTHTPFSSFASLHTPASLTRLVLKAVPLSQSCSYVGCRELLLNVFFCCPQLVTLDLSDCFERRLVPPEEAAELIAYGVRRHAMQGRLQGPTALQAWELFLEQQGEAEFFLSSACVGGQTRVGDVLCELMAHAAFNAKARSCVVPSAFASLQELHLSGSGLTDLAARGLVVALKGTESTCMLRSLAVLNVADNYLTTFGCVSLIHALVTQWPTSAGLFHLDHDNAGMLASPSQLVALALEGNAGVAASDSDALSVVCEAAESALARREKDHHRQHNNANATAAAAATATATASVALPLSIHFGPVPPPPTTPRAEAIATAAAARAPVYYAVCDMQGQLHCTFPHSSLAGARKPLQANSVKTEEGPLHPSCPRAPTAASTVPGDTALMAAARTAKGPPTSTADRGGLIAPEVSSIQGSMVKAGGVDYPSLIVSPQSNFQPASTDPRTPQRELFAEGAVTSPAQPVRGNKNDAAAVAKETPKPSAKTVISPTPDTSSVAGTQPVGDDVELQCTVNRFDRQRPQNKADEHAGGSSGAASRERPEDYSPPPRIRTPVLTTEDNSAAAAATEPPIGVWASQAAVAGLRITPLAPPTPPPPLAALKGTAAAGPPKNDRRAVRSPSQGKLKHSPLLPNSPADKTGAHHSGLVNSLSFEKFVQIDQYNPEAAAAAATATPPQDRLLSGGGESGSEPLFSLLTNSTGVAFALVDAHQQQQQQNQLNVEGLTPRALEEGRQLIAAVPQPLVTSQLERAESQIASQRSDSTPSKVQRRTHSFVVFLRHPPGHLLCRALQSLRSTTAHGTETRAAIADDVLDYLHLCVVELEEEEEETKRKLQGKTTPPAPSLPTARNRDSSSDDLGPGGDEGQPRAKVESVVCLPFASASTPSSSPPPTAHVRDTGALQFEITCNLRRMVVAKWMDEQVEEEEDAVREGRPEDSPYPRLLARLAATGRHWDTTAEVRALAASFEPAQRALQEYYNGSASVAVHACHGEQALRKLRETLRAAAAEEAAERVKSPPPPQQQQQQQHAKVSPTQEKLQLQQQSRSHSRHEDASSLLDTDHIEFYDEGTYEEEAVAQQQRPKQRASGGVHGDAQVVSVMATPLPLFVSPDSAKENNHGDTTAVVANRKEEKGQSEKLLTNTPEEEGLISDELLPPESFNTRRCNREEKQQQQVTGISSKENASRDGKETLQSAGGFLSPEKTQSPYLVGHPKPQSFFSSSSSPLAPGGGTAIENAIPNPIRVKRDEAHLAGRIKTFSISHSHVEGSLICRAWHLLHGDTALSELARGALQDDILALLQPRDDDLTHAVLSVRIVSGLVASNMLQLQVSTNERRATVVSRLSGGGDTACNAESAASASASNATATTTDVHAAEAAKYPRLTRIVQNSPQCDTIHLVEVYLAKPSRAELEGRLLRGYRSIGTLVHYFHGTTSALLKEVGVGSMEELEAVPSGGPQPKGEGDEGAEKHQQHQQSNSANATIKSSVIISDASDVIRDYCIGESGRGGGGAGGSSRFLHAEDGEDAVEMVSPSTAAPSPDTSHINRIPQPQLLQGLNPTRQQQQDDLRGALATEDSDELHTDHEEPRREKGMGGGGDVHASTTSLPIPPPEAHILRPPSLQNAISTGNSKHDTLLLNASSSSPNSGRSEWDRVLDNKHRRLMRIAYDGNARGTVPLDPQHQQKVLVGKGKWSGQRVLMSVEWEIMFVLTFERKRSFSQTKRAMMLVHPVACGFDCLRGSEAKTGGSSKTLVIRINRPYTPEELNLSSIQLLEALSKGAKMTRGSGGGKSSVTGRSLNATRQPNESRRSSLISEPSTTVSSIVNGDGGPLVTQLIQQTFDIEVTMDSKKSVEAALSMLKASIQRATQAVYKSMQAANVPGGPPPPSEPPSRPMKEAE